MSVTAGTAAFQGQAQVGGGGRKGKECEHDWAGPVGHMAGLMSPRDEEQWSPGSRGWTAVEEWPESPSVCVCVCVSTIMRNKGLPRAPVSSRDG